MEALGGPVTRGKRRRLEGSGHSAAGPSGGPSSHKIAFKLQLTEDEAAPEWIGDVLRSNQLIVAKIFEYLGVYGLSRAARVCRFWRRCAQQAARNRQMIKHFNVINLDVGGLDRKLFGRELVRSLRECYAAPSLVMIFTTKHMADEGSKYFDDFTGSREEFSRNVRKLQRTGKLAYNSALSNYLSTKLPPGSLLQLCSGWGLTVTDAVDGPIEHEDCEGFAAICISQFPNVKIRTFSVREPCRPSEGRVRPSACQLIHAAALGDVKDAKAVIAFSKEAPEPISNAMHLMDALVKDYPKLAIAGATLLSHGVYEPYSTQQDSSWPGRSKPDQSPHAEVGLCGIVIEGDVKAASIVLGHDCRGSEAVKEKMSELKSFPVIHGRTVGFMFSCCGRGQCFHLGVNVEGSVFGELFPGVPLMGVFGSGEFGVDTFSDVPPADFRFSYTSVIMLITFNPPPEDGQAN
ncbi:F-box only protein 22 [Galendromus occidentalis]|uniref:F-box only protein 22 n=1 Tax=Galendromus occidentalis TaxID=34638 RepID=A0AAJ6QMN8_9ACAR|nr:F-box only protein 22 [Galendromus occidentalis]